MFYKLDTDKKIFDALYRHYRELSELLPSNQLIGQPVQASIHYQTAYHLLSYGCYITEKYLDFLNKLGWIRTREIFEFGSPDANLQVEWRVTPGEDGELVIEKIDEYQIIIKRGGGEDIHDPLKWTISFGFNAEVVDGTDIHEAAMATWVEAFTALVKRHEALEKSQPAT